jgi:hypothetical protein
VRPILRKPFRGKPIDFDTYASVIENNKKLLKKHKKDETVNKFKHRFAKITGGSNTAYEAVEVYYDSNSDAWTEISGGYCWNSTPQSGNKTFNPLTTLNGETIATNTVVEVVCEPRQIGKWHPIYNDTYTPPDPPDPTYESIEGTYYLCSNSNSWDIVLDETLDYRGRHIESWIYHEANTDVKVQPVVDDSYIQMNVSDDVVLVTTTESPSYSVYIDKDDGSLCANATDFSSNCAVYWIRTSDYMWEGL